MRHHRQNLIPGWCQEKLSGAMIGITGSGPYPASFFLASAVALGLRRFIVICPNLDETFMSLARALDPNIQLAYLQGWVTHSATASLLDRCSVLVDFSQLGLSNKLLFNTARKTATPLITVRCVTETAQAGFRFFSYTPGKDTAAIHSMIAPRSLSAAPWNDPATAMAAAGLALEEVKRILFERPQTRTLVTYVRPHPAQSFKNLSVAIVGAGALGNFAAPTLVLLGCRRITVFDPDRVDVTNLNRQIFFAQDVGAMKALALAYRLNMFFGTEIHGVPQAFDEQTDLSPFDVVLDCVDNFETRLVLSRRAQKEGKILVSGGTGPDRGQVVCYHPECSRETPARILNLERLVRQRSLAPAHRHPEPVPGPETLTASCRLQADPSVVMSNQIIGAFMADLLHRMLSGEPPGMLFYESSETEGLRLTTFWKTDCEA